MSQFIYAVAGWLFIALALLGLALPLLPATPFALAAAACFARSSADFHRRLIESASLGPLIQDYRAGQGLRRATKRFLLGIVAASAILSSTVCFYNGQSLLWIYASTCIATLVIVLLPARAERDRVPRASPWGPCVFRD